MTCKGDDCDNNAIAEALSGIGNSDIDRSYSFARQDNGFRRLRLVPQVCHVRGCSAENLTECSIIEDGFEESNSVQGFKHRTSLSVYCGISINILYSFYLRMRFLQWSYNS